MVRAVAGGWKLAGIATVESGTPMNLAAVDPSATSNTTRPNLVGNPSLGVGRNRQQQIAEYFNTAAFAQPVIGTPGNLNGFGDFTRDGLIGPGYADTDLSLSKYFTLPGERLGKLGLRVDAFNAFNRVSLGDPGTTLGQPTLGEILGADPARILQVALRYEF